MYCLECFTIEYQKSKELASRKSAAGTSAAGTSRAGTSAIKARSINE
jgi:hypothetical protein